MEIIAKKRWKNKSYIRICIEFFHTPEGEKNLITLHFEMKHRAKAQNLVHEKNTGKMYEKCDKIGIFLKFLLTGRNYLCIISFASCDALLVNCGHGIFRPPSSKCGVRNLHRYF